MNITKGKIAKAQKVVLYGPEGIGKSSFAANFPDALFIDTEGSTSNMDVARLDKPSSWTFLLIQIEYVKQNKPCKTLIVDTIDWAERMAVENLCQTNQKKSIEDFGYGSGYIKLEEEIGRFLNVLQDVVDAGINVVLTAHAQIRKFEQPDEMGAYDRYELKLGKKTSSRTSALVKEWADMVLFMNYKTFSVAADKEGKKHKAQGGTRTIYTSHHPAWDAKNRHELPSEIPMDFSYIAHIFNGQVQSEKQAQDEQPQVNEQVVHQEQVPHHQEQVQQPVQSVQTEVQQQEIVPQQKTTLNPAIPKALQDLMIANNVTEEDIKKAVAYRGLYPNDTPIENYDPNFIDGCLIGAWEQVYAVINDIRDLPF